MLTAAQERISALKRQLGALALPPALLARVRGYGERKQALCNAVQGLESLPARINEQVLTHIMFEKEG